MSIASSFNPASEVFVSDDGVTWQQPVAKDLQGQSSELLVRGSIGTNGQKMIMASTVEASDERMHYYETTDGMHWQEKQTQEAVTKFSPKRPRQCVYAMGQYFLMGVNCAFTSSDGGEWICKEYIKDQRGWDNALITKGTSRAAYGLDWYYQDDTGNSKQFQDVASPNMGMPSNTSSSEIITAIAEFNGSLIYGTSFGNLNRKQSGDLFKKEPVKDYYYRGPNRLVLRSDNGVMVYRGAWTSGEGSFWNQSVAPENILTQYFGFADGLYWGANLEETVVGYSPQWYISARNANVGPDGYLTSIAEAPNGSVVAVVSLSQYSTVRRVMIKRQGEVDYTEVSTPFSGENYLVHRVGDVLYANGPGNSLFYASLNGEDWVDTELDGGRILIAKNEGDYFAVSSYIDLRPPKVRKSTDGFSWIDLDQDGLPMPESWTYSVLELVAHRGSLVARVKDEIYFSNDGETWAKVPLPDRVRSMATNNGQLVLVVGSHSALLHSGTPDAGQSAPVVEIFSHNVISQALLGSRITVKGRAYDPEDGDVTYTCKVDGKIVHSGIGQDFVFSFRMDSSGSHGVSVEATDSHGLLAQAGFLVETQMQSMQKFADDSHDISQVPAMNLVSHRGVFYAFKNFALYRSLTGLQWERLPIPEFQKPINST